MNRLASYFSKNSEVIVTSSRRPQAGARQLDFPCSSYAASHRVFHRAPELRRIPPRNVFLKIARLDSWVHYALEHPGRPCCLPWALIAAACRCTRLITAITSPFEPQRLGPRIAWLWNWIRPTCSLRDILPDFTIRPCRLNIHRHLSQRDMARGLECLLVAPRPCDALKI